MTVSPRICLLLAGALLASPLMAATPASGTLSPTATKLTVTSSTFNVSNPGYGDTGQCLNPALPCDDFALTVSVPASYLTQYPNAQVTVSTVFADDGVTDLDLYVLDSAGAEKAKSAGSANPEATSFTPAAGNTSFTVRVVPYTAAGSQGTTTITLDPGAPASGGGTGGTGSTGGGAPTPVVTGPASRYHNYFPPAGVGSGAGEPSIGYNEKTKRAMMSVYTTTLRLSFPENATPALPEACDGTYENKSYTGDVISLDPILWTDQITGRTFNSQLLTGAAGGAPVGGTSIFAYTDNDGDSWTPGQLAVPTVGYDHQSVGSGPYPASLSALSTPVNNGRAVYYCSQGGVDAYCTRSDNGGLTFNNEVPIQILTCTGLHGHIKVAGDGTAYVPDFNCGDTQGLIRSTDGGVNWAVKNVTGSTGTATYDPSVGIADDGTLYFCTIELNGHITAYVSDDKGESWINRFDLGAALGLQNGAFPQAVAGDKNRAACAFLGTTVAGNSGAMDFAGEWFGYVAHTYDHGKTWSTGNITPGDPVQRAGGICISGSGCSGNNRNLLDFNEVTKDEKGRVLFAYADGCTGACEKAPPNNFTDVLRVARQRGGRTLYEKFDAEFTDPHVPAASCLAGQRDTKGSYLSWKEPDNGGADITSYKIYRGTVKGSETLLAETGNPKITYTDASADPAVPKYFYKIIGVNSQGGTVFSNTVELPIAQILTESSCIQPGITVASDPTGDAVSTLAAHDLVSVNIAEPLANKGNFIVTIKVASLATLPPSTQWLVVYTTSAGDKFVEMTTETGTATYRYGDVAVVDANATSLTTYTTTGTLDASSTYKADGTITLIVPAAVMGGQTVDAKIRNVVARTRLVTSGQAGSVGRLMDESSTGDYVVKGTNICLPNTAPVASLLASVQTGTAPLTVTLNGAGSADMDAGDSIASYTFKCDVSAAAVTQSTPSYVCTYTKPATYQATLTVTDSRGLVSSNTAMQRIEVKSGTTPTLPVVTNPDGAASTSSRNTGRFGGGAFGLGLLPLLLLARRRVRGQR